MSSSWDARLEGGPFDGDGGLIDAPIPAKLWVEVCPRGVCGTHWFTNFMRGCEVYKLKDRDDKARSCKYEYDGLGSGGGGIENTEEVDSGSGITKRELVPA